MKRHMFIGRWQPFHRGHQWLIEQRIYDGPILICVRDIAPDENNPLTTEQTIHILETHFERYNDLIKRYLKIDREHVKIIVIPDIESVNYGRGVGYDIVEHVPPAEVGGVSATEIRKQIKENNTEWKNNIPPSIHKLVEMYLGGESARVE